ncbi:long-chain fatty acid-CoA ligase [Gonapodya sp. JEL0774]|nr:long-chain fatty acid-CoA ligase [Gonapodya sp. JEL0774]
MSSLANTDFPSAQTIVVSVVLIGVPLVAFFVMYAPKLRSLPFGQPEKDSETAPRRNWILFENGKKGDLVTSPNPDIKVALDVIRQSARKYGSQLALGQRKFLGNVKESKKITRKVGGQLITEDKEWSYFNLGPYHWRTFSEVQHNVALIGSGLSKLGLQKGETVMLYASTGRNWIETAHGSFWAGARVATAYDTLGASGLAFSLGETNAKFVFTHPDLLPTIVSIKSQTPDLRFIILGPAPLSNISPDAKAVEALTGAGIKVMWIDELKELGGGVKEAEDVFKGTPSLPEPVDVTQEDIALIMYTSGSTGTPKGVVITHRNVVAAMGGGDHIIGRNRNPKDNFYLAFLPLAHILEFTAEHSVGYRHSASRICFEMFSNMLSSYDFKILSNGMSIGYGTPKTLTAASVRNCEGDIMELKPTIMAGVPMVWDTVMKGIRDQVDNMPATTQKIFWWAFEAKWWCLERGLPTFLFDALVFNKIKARVGGRLQWALSGGALLSSSSQKFLWTTIAPVVQGYGLTETCAVLSIQDPTHVALGIAGEPLPSVEVKLIDVPDANYFVKNLPNPQGEILVRGGNIIKEYFKNPTATAEVLTPDGWFMTGDIGELLPDGTIRVIDRRKNLIKLAHGEYVALEKLESLYKLSKFVGNMLLHADILQTYIVGIVLPAEPALRKAAIELGLVKPDQFTTLDELAAMPELRKVVMDNFKSIVKEQGLKGSDIVGNIRLVGGEWTPQNGMLTAAQKIKRKDVVGKYQNLVSEMYEEGKM